ncbi:helix-turn-helix domain-containing protein [Allomuricauda sp. F6463D]|uniref:helix-turn-helix domain-containing protein n=1 Tax=Allomuricauda sp. F6463D TaxID=2926409 RepID=UPI001FF6DBBF|nr:helix-turn-helix domain-containing protein [Muricauda sp. F6463D]MCK0161588.1 helix-turn-helix domain-containing protein [Muricauda sp. F6463D]
MSFWEYTQLLIKKKEGPLSKKLLVLFSFLFLYTVFVTIYIWLYSSDKLYLLFVIPLFVYSVVIFLLSRQPDLLHERNYNLNHIQKKGDKYEKTGLSAAFSLELKYKLEHLMNEDKLYLQHELKLDDLATLLNISRHHASQVINENFNMSFYDFINSYRIEEAKTSLSSGFENRSTSISDIAYQCGFNNRVSFYKAFKKITQVTPKEFVQNAA